MRIKHLLLGVLASCYFCACGSILSKDRASFRLDSVPKGAKVTTDSGAVLGFTPIVLKLPKTAQSNSQRSLYIGTSGHKTAKITITPEFNKKVLLNFAFISTTLGLPSFTIDQSNGMLYKYESDSYVVELKKIPPPVVNERTNEEAAENARVEAVRLLKEKAKKAQQEREEAEAKAQAEKEKLEAEQQAKTEAKLKAEQQVKIEAETRLEAERKRLADEKAKLAAEKAEIERLKLEAERLELEKERKKLEQEKKALQKSLQEASEDETPESDSKVEPPPSDSPEETLRKKEEELLKRMRRRYENQLKRKKENRPKRDSRIPDIEVDPLSSETQSPSYGALALSIARHQVLLRDFALGEGPTSQELFLRLCLALKHDLNSKQVIALYPQFMKEMKSSFAVLSAPHGLALFRAVKPIQESLLALK